MNHQAITEEYIITELRRLSKDLESSDPKIIEEVAYKISGILLEWKNGEDYSDPKFLEIENAALDLEIPKEHIEDYDEKLKLLKSLISSL